MPQAALDQLPFLFWAVFIWGGIVFGLDRAVLGRRDNRTGRDDLIYRQPDRDLVGGLPDRERRRLTRLALSGKRIEDPQQNAKAAAACRIALAGIQARGKRQWTFPLFGLFVPIRFFPPDDRSAGRPWFLLGVALNYVFLSTVLLPFLWRRQSRRLTQTAEANGWELGPDARSAADGAGGRGRHRGSLLGALSELEAFFRRHQMSGPADMAKEARTARAEDPEAFRELMTSLEWWGGSGALWEMNIAHQTGDRSAEREFRQLIVRLVEQLDAEGFATERARFIASTFRTWLHQVPMDSFYPEVVEEVLTPVMSSHGFSHTGSELHSVHYERERVRVFFQSDPWGAPRRYVSIAVGLQDPDGRTMAIGLWRALPDGGNKPAPWDQEFKTEPELRAALHRIIDDAIPLAAELWNNEERLVGLITDQQAEAQQRYEENLRRAELLKARRAFDEGRYSEARDVYVLIGEEQLSAADRRRLYISRKKIG